MWGSKRVNPLDLYSVSLCFRLIPLASYVSPGYRSPRYDYQQRSTAVLKRIEYGLYEEYIMVRSKIRLHLLQDR